MRRLLTAALLALLVRGVSSQDAWQPFVLRSFDGRETQAPIRILVVPETVVLPNRASFEGNSLTEKAISLAREANSLAREANSLAREANSLTREANLSAPEANSLAWEHLQSSR